MIVLNYKFLHYIERVICLNYKIIVSLNSMNYDGDNINDIVNNLNPDYFTNYNMFIGLEWQPSAVDSEIINILIDILDGPLTIISAALLKKLGEDLYELLKKSFKTKGKTVEKPTIEINIHIQNNSYTIGNLQFENIDILKEKSEEISTELKRRGSYWAITKDSAMK